MQTQIFVPGADRRSAGGSFRSAESCSGTGVPQFPQNFPSNGKGVDSTLGDTSMKRETPYFQRDFTTINRVRDGTKPHRICQVEKNLAEIRPLTNRGPTARAFTALGNSNGKRMCGQEPTEERLAETIEEKNRSRYAIARATPRWVEISPGSRKRTEKRPTKARGIAWSRVSVARVRQAFRVAARLKSLSTSVGD